MKIKSQKVDPQLLGIDSMVEASPLSCCVVF